MSNASATIGRNGLVGIERDVTVALLPATPPRCHSEVRMRLGAPDVLEKAGR